MNTVVDSYDAVIVGASFAGLAAATQLRDPGRVLLVDREPLGAAETSACGTLLAVLERLDALEQAHPEIAVNAGAAASCSGPPIRSLAWNTARCASSSPAGWVTWRSRWPGSTASRPAQRRRRDAPRPRRLRPGCPSKPTS